MAIEDVYKQSREAQKAANDALLRALLEEEQKATQGLAAGAASRGVPESALSTILAIPQAQASSARVLAQQRGESALSGLTSREAASRSGLESQTRAISEMGRIRKELEGAQTNFTSQQSAARQRRAKAGGGGRGGGGGKGGAGGDFDVSEIRWLADLVESGDVSLEDIGEDAWKVQAELGYRGRSGSAQQAEYDAQNFQDAWKDWLAGYGPDTERAPGSGRRTMGFIEEDYGSEIANKIRARVKKAYPTPKKSTKKKSSFLRRGFGTNVRIHDSLRRAIQGL